MALATEYGTLKTAIGTFVTAVTAADTMIDNDIERILREALHDVRDICISRGQMAVTDDA